MPSISSILSDGIEGIIDDYNTHSGALSKVAPELREKLLTEENILTFSRGDLTHKSLVAIDGGRLKEDMAGGDLIVVGATAGEGHSTVTLYDDDTVPAEAYASVLPHRTSNEKLAAGIMSALELRLLEKANADVQIIDGAYINNVSQIIYTIIENNDETVDSFFKAINYDEDHLLRNSMLKVLNPERDYSRTLIALPKSDTAHIYSNAYMEGHDLLQGLVSDRILASRMLHPGEMFMPRNIESNNALIQKLERKTFKRYTGEHQELYDSMLEMKLEYLRKLSLKATEEGILWATYFKPNVGTPQSKALKIEFPYYMENSDGLGNERLIRHARKLIGMVDADMIDGYVIEPWSQYMADIRAKDVSAAKEIIKNYLIATTEDSYDLAGLLRNYRT